MCFPTLFRRKQNTLWRECGEGWKRRKKEGIFGKIGGKVEKT
jgi:hypothetical protein